MSGETLLPSERPTADPYKQLAVSSQSTAMAAAEAGAKAEILIAAEMAYRSPRDESKALEKLLQTCKNKMFADKAHYSFKRGGSKIEGASVYLARELARVWGNIRYGNTITGSGQGKMRIEGWAWDLNPGNNVRVTCPAEFELIVQRKNRETGETEWVDADERDARELTNKQCALAERNALLKLIPPHVLQAAMDVCTETRKKDSAEALKSDRVGTINKLQMAFAELDVSVGMLERRLGRKLKEMTGDDLAEFRDLYRAIQAGEIKREDVFSADEHTPEADSKVVDVTPTPTQTVTEMFKPEPKK